MQKILILASSTEMNAHLEKQYYVEKVRLQQEIEYIRRLKPIEMAEFKFISNFRVNLDTRDILLDLYRSDKDQIQDRLATIPTLQILEILLYLDLC